MQAAPCGRSWPGLGGSVGVVELRAMVSQALLFLSAEPEPVVARAVPSDGSQGLLGIAGASGMHVVRFDLCSGDFFAPSCTEACLGPLLAGAALPRGMGALFRGVSCTSWTEDDTRLGLPALTASTTQLPLARWQCCAIAAKMVSSGAAVAPLPCVTHETA